MCISPSNLLFKLPKSGCSVFPKNQGLIVLSGGSCLPAVGSGKFNLIPFNPFPDSGYQRSTKEVIRQFAQILYDAGFVTTTRRTRGDDIDAACGQLAGQVKDKTKRRLRVN